MKLANLARILVGAAALSFTAGAALAVPLKEGMPAAAFEVPTGPVNDRIVDPQAIAVKAALEKALEDGVFPSTEAAAAVTEYYQAQGFVPSWTADGKFTE